MRSKRMNPAVQAISDALDRPEDWAWDEHRLNHIPSGLSLWMAGGRHCFRIYQGDVRPQGLRRLWRKAVLARDLALAGKFRPHHDPHPSRRRP